ESETAGVFLCMNKSGSQIFAMGHAEYDRLTLDSEYKRDLSKGLTIDMPINYYPENDPNNKPDLVWRGHANNLYSNWLNYYVYQNTPYKWGQILDEEKRRRAHSKLTLGEIGFTEGAGI
ncbi:MAG: homoserine O-succinyltransferase, partial [Succinivibrio sp.]|nr:homoserine O-succinyltransferase [Succinivibrio sp.]